MPVSDRTRRYTQTALADGRAADELLRLVDTGGGVAVPSVQCSGDSITFGFGLTNQNQAYPALTGVVLGSGWLVENRGRSGWTVGSSAPGPAGSLLAVDPPTIGPLWSQQRPLNIFSACGGSNDLFYTEDLAALKTNYAAWCREMRVFGYKVIAWTLMARTIPGAFEANRQAFNTWVRTSYLQFADDLCDVALVPELGAPGADTNLTYFQDGAHPTAAGHIKIEPTFTATVRRVFAVLSPSYVAQSDNRPAYVTGHSIFTQLSGGPIVLNNCAFINGNFAYIDDGFASILWLTANNELTFYGAPSGTAGQSPVSFSLNWSCSGAGTVTMRGMLAVAGLVNAANDGAAATAGVSVNGLYHNAGAVRVRLV